ncbi:hypothetical protein F6476_12470 [Pseudomonas umsongensis]|nr:hypothetical protein F6476_12470 [Pseudomonas umsongensis]
MLAMVVNDNEGSLAPRGALRFFASMLAPMYGLAPTFNPFLNTDTRLHLCIRPVRGSIFGFWPKLVELAVCRLQ